MLAKPLIRHLYDGLQDEVSHSTGLNCSGPPELEALTRQADKDAADINNITKRYESTGRLPELIKRDPRYGDFSSVPNYTDAMEIVLLAESQFEALDAHIRGRFLNDPGKFLEFATDPKNLDELRRLGLAKPLVETPIPAPAPGSSGPGAKPDEKPQT